jgi:UDP-N-acetylmuramate--alanine ligase
VDLCSYRLIVPVRFGGVHLMKHVHFIGIGGTGLSAIARVLLESGYSVSGSDCEYSPLAESVEAAGAKIFVGHKPSNLNEAEIVVRSSAIPDDNVEVQAALANGIPVLKRAEFLGQIMEGQHVIAVAGTHGKTSTTAMIAWMLTELGQTPSFIVGSVINGLNVNARAGDGTAFVVEADEYDRMFLGLRPNTAVVTNVEHDHPDCFPTEEDFRAAFRDFVGRVETGGLLLACGDDPGALDLQSAAESANVRWLTYGIYNSQNNYQARKLEMNPRRGGFSFDVIRDGSKMSQCSLQVPGSHNVWNAMAALAAADQMGLSINQAAQALESFQGTGRRFEIMGEAKNVTVISDYAHHPTEIRATLSAARSRYPGREIWAAWQPHTYTRTNLLLSEFASSFKDAHHVLVTEVYYAREPRDPYFSSEQVVKAMDHPDPNFVPDLPGAVELLLNHLKPMDVLLVLSAGDAHQICEKVLTRLNEKSDVNHA